MSRVSGKFLLKFFEQEVPSGTINGSNTAFSLAQTPQENAAVLLFIDGILQRQGTDYTLSGTSITMTTAPATNQSIDAWYVRKTGE